MCRQASFIAVRNKNTEAVSVHFSKQYDSHSKILNDLGISDTSESPDFVRLEVTPPENQNILHANLNDWIMKVDQDLLPIWWSECSNYIEHTIKSEKLPEYLKFRIGTEDGVYGDGSFVTSSKDSEDSKILAGRDSPGPYI